jgi:phosphodiesterase/alkaline phosphatase D-like protein
LAAVRRRWIALVTGMVATSGVVAPALAASPMVVSTGNATSVTMSGADLNGIVNIEGQHSQWLFEYTAQAGFKRGVKVTPAVAAGVGLRLVERRVTGLKPGTTYYWRVVVRQHVAKDERRYTGRIARLTTAHPPTQSPPDTTTTPTTGPYAIDVVAKG